MLLAQLHGKLSPLEERSEDLLTSNVFGAFKYSGRIDALSAFLAGATALLEGAGPLPPFVRVEYAFWPWLEDDACRGCEPDLVLRVEHLDRTKSLIGIEAKYRSGKSSLPVDDAPVNDQLGRQWLALCRLGASEGHTRCLLVYLTADAALPLGELEQTRRELEQKRPDQRADVRWLSWRVLPSLLARWAEPILVDLVALLRRAGLTLFEGITPAMTALPASYLFGGETIATADAATFPWPPPLLGPSFTFTDQAAFTWPDPPAPIPWSFSV